MFKLKDLAAIAVAYYLPDIIHVRQLTMLPPELIIRVQGCLPKEFQRDIFPWYVVSKQIDDVIATFHILTDGDYQTVTGYIDDKIWLNFNAYKGIAHGDLTFYDTEGTAILKHTYHLDEQTDFYQWHSNGRLQTHRRYKNGKSIGEIINYTRDGAIKMYIYPSGSETNRLWVLLVENCEPKVITYASVDIYSYDLTNLLELLK